MEVSDESDECYLAAERNAELARVDGGPEPRFRRRKRAMVLTSEIFETRLSFEICGRTIQPCKAGVPADRSSVVGTGNGPDDAERIFDAPEAAVRHFSPRRDDAAASRFGARHPVAALWHFEVE